MLHIKDIEAFAHINEALAKRQAEQAGDTATLAGTDTEPGAGRDDHQPALHPALLLALAARAQRIPYRDDADTATGSAGDRPSAEPPTSLASVIARLLFPR